MSRVRSSRRLLVYGATGFTGRLVAAEAVRRGLAPLLAGRDAAALADVSASLGAEARAFPLDRSAAVQQGLSGVGAVLHCAGPFSRTSAPMLAACLAARCHYLDITGEIEVFEAILGRRVAIREAGIVALPGVGFDVVPTDCLAARLAAALPAAERLDLAFASRGGSWSAGTLLTALEGLPRGGAERRDGRIVPVPIAAEVREIDFGPIRRSCASIPWGDVSTAYHTTGIPNIRVFTAMPRQQVRVLRALRPLLRVAGAPMIRRALAMAVRRGVSGPDQSARETARAYVWGRATAPGGRSLTGTVQTPEAYSFTAVSAVECAARVLRGAVEPGAWTPAAAFGFELLNDLPGVEIGRLDEEDRESGPGRTHGAG